MSAQKQKQQQQKQQSLRDLYPKILRKPKGIIVTEYIPNIVAIFDNGCAHEVRTCKWCGKQCIYSHNEVCMSGEIGSRLDIRTPDQLHKCLNYRMCQLEELGYLS